MKQQSLQKNRLSVLTERVTLGGLLLGMSLTAMSMDLMQAYDAAKTQDANILAARAAAQAGRERVPQARAQLLPNVAFNVTGNKNQLSSTSTDFLGQEQTIETYYPSSNQTLSARQPLYRPQLQAQYRQAQAQVKESEALLQQEEQALIVRVSGFYFEALAAGEQLELVLAQRATVTTQLDAARKIFAAGSGVRTDVDEALARLDMTLALEIEARQNVNYTLEQLQTMVRQPVEKLATLSASKFSQIDPKLKRLDDWTEKAERVNPQLQQGARGPLLHDGRQPRQFAGLTLLGLRARRKHRGPGVFCLDELWQSEADRRLPLTPAAAENRSTRA